MPSARARGRFFVRATAHAGPLGLLLGVLLCAAAPLRAQQGFAFVPRRQSELRVEADLARSPSALAMLGANIPLGYYVRAGVAAGGGAVKRDASARLALRADITVRFLLDPFAEHRWGPYAGGGLTVRRDAPDRAAAGVMLLLGVEGRRGARWVPSFEAALGQGGRVALVLRRARTNGR